MLFERRFFCETYDVYYLFFICLFSVSRSRRHTTLRFTPYNRVRPVFGAEITGKKVESRETREHIAPSSHSAMRIM